MQFFNHEFKYLDSHFLDDLQHLESEGAMYAQFFQDDSQSSRFCRIQFKPAEIVEYVKSCIACDEFLGFTHEGDDPSVALNKIQDKSIADRVRRYNNWTISIGQLDTIYCFAAFIGKSLESLVCGGMPSRYEYLAQSYSGDRRYLLTEILEGFPGAVGILTAPSGGRPNYVVDREIAVRDLLYAIVKCTFPDAKIEDHTGNHAGSSKRIDIVLPALSTVIEIKYVRDAAHSRKVADELKIDFESYHKHPDCKKFFAYIWDPNRLIIDRHNFIEDLRGLRQKGDSIFSVDVLVKP